uniref:Lipid phosphate phosphatase delta n=1 Tax=Noccaea caerulescens TaxID=107243 RepID=A0A1J3G262_NOCCA
MEGSGTWQGLVIVSIVTWICLSSYLKLTHKFRSLLQPWVARQVVGGVPLILNIQKHQNGVLDAFFSGLSCVVSVPFYTAFLPLLFWSGHGRLARQMTLLIAFCDYLGNCIKDVVSAPRPSCPPVRRITATKDEEDNAMEYGLPSSHTLNTVCLSGYLLHYVLSSFEHENASIQYYGFAFACLLVALIAFGRIYLGMHSVVDIIAGLAIGVLILGLWLTVNEKIDDFITSKQNVSSFWTALSFLLLFAYPTPEHPTPSYEYHTAFNGVALGIVTGVQQTYSQFHHEAAPRIFSPELPVSAYLGRVMVGIPTILLVKFCSKSLAKWILPTVSNALGIPIRSSTYIPKLKLDNGYANGKKTDEIKNSVGYLQKLCEFLKQESFDVDTGIRFLQYAGLAWSVVDLVPSLFSYINL